MFFLTTIRRWFRDRNRNIFPYFDGVRSRYADPVQIGTALEAELPDYADLLMTLAQPPASVPPGPTRTALIDQQRDAVKRLAAAARKVLDLPPLDTKTGWGATEANAMAVIVRYYLYMEKLARDAELFQDSPVPESDSRPV